MTFLAQHVAQWLIAALPIGTLSFAVGQAIKRLSGWIDGQPPVLKSVVLVPAVVSGVTALGAALHVPIVCPPDTNCLTSLDGSTLDAVVKAALAWLVALGTHAIRKGEDPNAPVR